jgi:hypothetical protein
VWVRCARSSGLTLELFLGRFLVTTPSGCPCHIMKQLTRHEIGLTHATLACSWPMYGDPCFHTGVRKGARSGPFVSPLLPPYSDLKKATVHRHHHRERFVLSSALDNGSCVFAASSAVHDETRHIRNMIHVHVMTMVAANTSKTCQ